MSVYIIQWLVMLKCYKQCDSNGTRNQTCPICHILVVLTSILQYKHGKQWGNRKCASTKAKYIRRTQTTPQGPRGGGELERSPTTAKEGKTQKPGGNHWSMTHGIYAAITILKYLRCFSEHLVCTTQAVRLLANCYNGRTTRLSSRVPSPPEHLAGQTSTGKNEQCLYQHGCEGYIWRYWYTERKILNDTEISMTTLFSSLSSVKLYRRPLTLFLRGINMLLRIHGIHDALLHSREWVLHT